MKRKLSADQPLRGHAVAPAILDLHELGVETAGRLASDAWGSARVRGAAIAAVANGAWPHPSGHAA